MIKAMYRPKFTIGMAWLCAPLFCGTALSYVAPPGGPDLDAFGLLAAVSTGLVGLLYLWILVKRRVPIVAISDQTLELGPTFPFQRARSLPIDEIDRVALERRTLVVETQAGSVRFPLLGIAANELHPVLAAIQRRIEERKLASGGN